METNNVWRDITDPRIAEIKDDLEEGLKEPKFENITIPEHFGPVRVTIDDHKIKRYAFELDDYLPWSMEEKENPFGKERIAQAGLLTNDIVQLFTLAYRGSKVIGLHTEAQLWFKSPAKLNEVVTLGAAFHVAHGESNYAVFTGVMNHYMERRTDGEIAVLNRFLADILECREGEVYEELEKLLGSLLPKKALREYGVPHEKLAEFADSVMENQGRLMANNFVEINREQVLEIYNRLY